MIVPSTIIDEGASVCILSSIAWQALCSLPLLPTQPTLPRIFSSLCLGALRLANPDFLLFFWLSSYLNLSLFLPGAQIKQLSTLASLPI